jgi:hypothetical protein
MQLIPLMPCFQNCNWVSSTAWSCLVSPVFIVGSLNATDFSVQLNRLARMKTEWICHTLVRLKLPPVSSNRYLFQILRGFQIIIGVRSEGCVIPCRVPPDKTIFLTKPVGSLYSSVSRNLINST